MFWCTIERSKWQNHTAQAEIKKTKLLEIVSTEILAVDTGFHEDTDLFEAGLDSMAIMQLLIRIESEFGVRLRVGDINRDNFSTVRKISSLLA